MVIAALLGGGIMFVAMCAYIYRYRARWATPAVRAENAELREQHKADAAEITRHKAREAVMFSRPIVRAGEAVKKAIEEAGREL